MTYSIYSGGVCTLASSNWTCIHRREVRERVRSPTPLCGVRVNSGILYIEVNARINPEEKSGLSIMTMKDE